MKEETKNCERENTDVNKKTIDLDELCWNFPGRRRQYSQQFAVFKVKSLKKGKRGVHGTVPTRPITICLFSWLDQNLLPKISRVSGCKLVLDLLHNEMRPHSQKTCPM